MIAWAPELRGAGCLSPPSLAHAIVTPISTDTHAPAYILPKQTYGGQAVAKQHYPNHVQPLPKINEFIKL